MMHVVNANPRWRGKAFLAFPAHVQPTILSICRETHEDCRLSGVCVWMSQNMIKKMSPVSVKITIVFNHPESVTRIFCWCLEKKTGDGWLCILLFGKQYDLTGKHPPAGWCMEQNCLVVWGAGIHRHWHWISSPYIGQWYFFPRTPTTLLLFGEFTGHWWIPQTQAINVELWCLSLIWAWTNRVNNRNAGDLGHHRAHYDVTVMIKAVCTTSCKFRSV